jgi:hypothetical protein
MAVPHPRRTLEAKDFRARIACKAAHHVFDIGHAVAATHVGREHQLETRM